MKKQLEEKENIISNNKKLNDELNKLKKQLEEKENNKFKKQSEQLNKDNNIKNKSNNIKKINESNKQNNINHKLFRKLERTKVRNPEINSYSIDTDISNNSEIENNFEKIYQNPNQNNNPINNPDDDDYIYKYIIAASVFQYLPLKNMFYNIN